MHDDDGDDTMHSGSGNDLFMGNEGNDTFIDNEGNDTYHIKDHDTFYDSDGQGKNLFIDTNLKDCNQNEGIVIENYFKPSPIHLMMNHTHSPVIEQLYVNGKLVGYGEMMDKLTVVGV